MARRKISVEQIAGVPPLRRRPETRRRDLRARHRHQGRKDARRNSCGTAGVSAAPHDLSADYRHYRDYIRRSKGEFTVAKDQYVRLNTGWFSDRSACYLAAGRPVITQETGFTRIYGGGRHGLIAFQSLGEIAEAVKEINADYTRHSSGRPRNRPPILRSGKGAAVAPGACRDLKKIRTGFKNLGCSVRTLHQIACRAVRR